MKLPALIALLHDKEKLIKDAGGDPSKSDVMVEAWSDEARFYYESDFELYVDDNNDIGISPLNK